MSKSFAESFAGKNQRKIMLYLDRTAAESERWIPKEEILAGTGLSDAAFHKSVSGLIRRDLVDVKEHPDDARRRVYRRRETI